ncbi:hypothetical protein GA0115240_13652 [Streptomyces sp. DvalAA-14]|nr:hypothetical protein GA0115240_13652 [Streptomyces sp. DvalAA-14]
MTPCEFLIADKDAKRYAAAFPVPAPVRVPFPGPFTARFRPPSQLQEGWPSGRLPVVSFRAPVPSARTAHTAGVPTGPRT